MIFIVLIKTSRRVHSKRSGKSVFKFLIGLYSYIGSTEFLSAWNMSQKCGDAIINSLCSLHTVSPTTLAETTT